MESAEVKKRKVKNVKKPKEKLKAVIPRVAESEING